MYDRYMVGSLALGCDTLWCLRNFTKWLALHQPAPDRAEAPGLRSTCGPAARASNSVQYVHQ